MNVIGIIAEYNPFHNGHAYQIAHVRKNLHADYIVVAASGDYVQRGEPALLDKYTRARMALSSGADLVLELPVLWSTASAELFADAGISLFEKTGCVNGICFGAESGDLALLRRIADVLADEPADLKASLKHNLKSGNTFPSDNDLWLEQMKAICRSHESDEGYRIPDLIYSEARQNSLPSDRSAGHKYPMPSDYFFAVGKKA